MKQTLFKLFSIVLLVALEVPALAQRRAEDILPGWMAGTWMMEDGANWADEIWTSPRGGVMLGVSRTGFGPQLQVWETTRMAVNGDGTISFFAQPMGKPATEFKQALVGPDSIEFTNTSHDYPQRIRYWRQGQLLMAEISRIDGSDAMRWHYRPVATAQGE